MKTSDFDYYLPEELIANYPLDNRSSSKLLVYANEIQHKTFRDIDNYFEEFPKIKKYMDTTISFAKENGYVETIFKRKRFLANINSGNTTMRGFDERNAINAPIQGSAADIMKIAMINIHTKLLENKMQSNLLLQVHDELVFEIIKDEEKEMIKLVKDEMMNAVRFNVPLEVEIGLGDNWLIAH